MPANGFHSKEAEKQVRQKIAEGSQNPDDYRDLTDLLFPSGHYEEAIALYKQALTLPITSFKKAQLSMELGWIYYDTGQQAQALPLARDALSLLSAEPRTAEVLYCLGASQAVLAFCLSPTDPNARDEAALLALEWLEQAIADDTDFKDKPFAYIDAARMHSMLGNLNNAIMHCERCLKQEINEMQRIACLIVYAQSLQREERFKEAEQAITEAFRYGKNYKSWLFQTLYLELGTIQRFTNRVPEAKRTFEQALAAVKADPYFNTNMEILGDIYSSLATVCYELAEYGEAILAYKEAVRCSSQDDPSHWTDLYWLGRSYEATEAYHEARDCYEKVAASLHVTEGEKALARTGLMWVRAKLDYESGKYKEAAAEFEQVVSHYPKDNSDHWLAILWLGSCRESLGHYAEARSLYEEVVGSSHTSDADKMTARKGLARSLARLSYESGDYEEAAAKYEEVVGHYPETDPDHWITMIWLGCCYQELAAYTKEQECYRKVLASRHATDDDKTLARRRLTLSLGKTYYEAKNYPEAIAAFEEVLASCSDDHAHRFHALVCLGYSYLAIKAHTKARACFEQVVASPHAPEPEKAAARKVLARLTTI